MLTEQMIREQADALGIPMIGIIDPDPLTAHLEHLKQRAFTPFCHIAPEKRIDVRWVFPEVKTVIVIGLPYPLMQIAASKDRFHMASFARGRDYHIRVREKLTALAERLMDLTDPFRYRIFVDDGKLLDRAAAYEAGLGFFGKNNLLIHPVYGSAFTIGQLLLDRAADHAKAEPMACGCGSCDRCLKACPSHALGKDGAMDTARCLSYLTQKKRVTAEELALIGSQPYGYGCDRCQLVCPFNGPLIQSPDSDRSPLSVETLLAMDDTAFDAAFGESAVHWRGRQVLQRNADTLIKQ